MARITSFLGSPIRSLALVATVVATGWCHGAASEVPVMLSIDTAHPQQVIAPEFAGLSYEVGLVPASASGIRYFRPNNTALVTLFQTLGIGNLRIGGNTSDRNAGELPKEADLDSLFEFARAAHVKIIYCLRLHEGDPAAATRTVKYIMSHYGSLMDSFSIGQEPSAYPTEAVDQRPLSERMGGAAEKYPYPSYQSEWKQFADSISAEVPMVKFCGPSVHNNPEWTRHFIADFGKGNHVALITAHLYPGGAAGKLPSAEVGRDRMLSDEFTKVYEALYAGFVPQAKAANLPYRLEEANSYFNGGAQGASNTFAAALWGLDFLYWWAAHDAAGINFHTGDRVAAGPNVRGSRYAVFVSAPGGYTVLPLAYAMKAFAVGSHGRMAAVTTENSGNLNLTAYAVQADNTTTYVTIINKEHGTNARDARVTVSLSGKIAGASVMALRTGGGDVAADTDITIGNAAIEKDGTWNGTWTALPVAEIEDRCSVSVPAASAAVIKIRR
jgi:hypothetical protein